MFPHESPNDVNGNNINLWRSNGIHTTSGSSTRWEWDVFLSHSGKQKNFVRRLHRDLTTEHVSCFFDEDRKCLPLAQKFPPRILKAAETCKLAVVVLSKEFIRSKWPMIELSAFISTMHSDRNAKLILLPIFFMISPEELSRITTDSSGWQKLEESSETRGKWQHALKEVRSINGLHFGEDDNELDFRGEVVKAICCLLKGIDPGFPIQGEAPDYQSQTEVVHGFLLTRIKSYIDVGASECNAGMKIERVTDCQRASSRRRRV